MTERNKGYFKNLVDRLRGQELVDEVVTDVSKKLQRQEVRSWRKQRDSDIKLLKSDRVLGVFRNAAKELGRLEGYVGLSIYKPLDHEAPAEPYILFDWNVRSTYNKSSFRRVTCKLLRGVDNVTLLLGGDGPVEFEDLPKKLADVIQKKSLQPKEERPIYHPL